MSQQVVVTHGRCHEGTENIFVFTQLRFHCSKNKGRTLHLTMAGNSSGEAVVQYFSGQTDANPKACGSFVRMKDDNSKLAADCNQWGSKEWGYPHSGKSRYRIIAFVPWKYIWNFYGNSRWECDDYSFNDAEYSGGFLFVKAKYN